MKDNIGSKFGFISFIANARDLIVCAKLDHINKKKIKKCWHFHKQLDYLCPVKRITTEGDITHIKQKKFSTINNKKPTLNSKFTTV